MSQGNVEALREMYGKGHARGVRRHADDCMSSVARACQEPLGTPASVRQRQR